MNKNLLNAALVLIPKKLQHKAVSKALNYLLPSQHWSFGTTRSVKIEVIDLKRQWFLALDKTGFQLAPSKPLAADIIVRASLDAIIAAQSLPSLQQALLQNEIEVHAEDNDKASLNLALNSITQSKLDTLIEYCYAFLRMIPRPRIDINTVTLDDIKTVKDVAFIRDEAIKLEDKNLDQALHLMELAQQARPNGPYINQKVREYRASLEQR
ncbi:hypothetical protein RCJ22_14265 [Vibrio sp. FNV 38]|nr:hypothetical protein [Vibrio sp. FNV 38]